MPREDFATLVAEFEERELPRPTTRVLPRSPSPRM